MFSGKLSQLKGQKLKLNALFLYSARVDSVGFGTHDQLVTS